MKRILKVYVDLAKKSDCMDLNDFWSRRTIPLHAVCSFDQRLVFPPYNRTIYVDWRGFCYKLAITPHQQDDLPIRQDDCLNRISKWLIRP